MKQSSKNRAWKGWLSTAAGLIGIQILLVLFEQIGWSPNLRDDNSLMMRIWDYLMETSLFTDYFNMYTSDFFNFFTFISVVVIAGQTIFLLFSIILNRD